VKQEKLHQGEKRASQLNHITLSQGAKLETHWHNKGTQQIEKNNITIAIIIIIIINIIIIIRIGQLLSISNPIFISKFVKKTDVM